MVKRLLVSWILVTGVTQAAMAAPDCPASDQASTSPQKRVRKVFPGSIDVSETTKQDRHYFEVQLDAKLPHLTRVELSLYYVSGEPPVQELADEQIVRVSRGGEVHADLLGFRRELWAGCYRLVVSMNPHRQVPSVLKTLGGIERTVRREKNWYHGTPELRKRQESRAIDRAQRDFRRFLLLLEQFKRFVRSSGSSRPLPHLNPFIIRVQFPQTWLIWSNQWENRFEKLTSSNQRRPVFDGRPVSFFFMESRTAYFLGNYIRTLENLYQRFGTLMWTYGGTMEARNRVLKKLRHLRERVVNTMHMIDLTVPLSRKQKAAVNRILDRSSDQFEKLTGLVAGSETVVNEERRDHIRDRLRELQSLLFQVDAGTPDLFYREVLELSRQLQDTAGRMSRMEPDQLKQRIKHLYRTFTDVRDLARSLVEEAPGDSGD